MPSAPAPTAPAPNTLAPRKTIHLLSNAHLDPVWLWRWDDGLSEALSTYRIAADFCEQDPGFVFNHNEALLYRWVEQHDPALFERIRALVSAGRWHIAGGAYLQPDLNTPSGEGLIRQFLVGKTYFAEKFGRSPTTAYNYDSFGQPEGFPQILAGCGFDSYVFCRPGFGTFDLPRGVFEWKDRSGTSVLARRSDDHYQSQSVNVIREKLTKWIEHFKDEQHVLLLWGIGNHGGGASREILDEFATWTREHPEHTVVHSTPEKYFAAVRRTLSTFPQFSGEMQHMAPGCYTSMARVKRAHRRAESLALSIEKLASLAWWNQLADYPAETINTAWRDILFAQFHDILPGSCIQSAEQDALDGLAYATEILRRTRAKVWVNIAQQSPRAAEGMVPIFVFNPHGFAVDAPVECEYMIAHAGVEKRHTIDIRLTDQDGSRIVHQREKEEANTGYDWRVKVAARVKLQPFEVRRIDATFSRRKTVRPPIVTVLKGTRFQFQNSGISVTINPATGLVDHLSRPRGVSMVKRGALQPVVFADQDNPWSCGDPYDRSTSLKGSAGTPWHAPMGRFRLATPKETFALVSPPSRLKGPSAPKNFAPVRIIEDGAVRTIVEAIFVWEHNAIIRHYILGKKPACFEIRDTVCWQGKDMMLKLEVPYSTNVKGTTAETPYSALYRETGDKHLDVTSQRWVSIHSAMRGAPVLSVVNDGCFAHSATRNAVYLNVLRSPAYASFGIGKFPDEFGARWLPRQDQGEHVVSFGFHVAARFDETTVRQYADLLNARPDTFIHYPGGDGAEAQRATEEFLRASPSTVAITAVKKAESSDALIVRVLETAGKATEFSVGLGSDQYHGEIGAYQLATLRVERSEGALKWSRVNLVEAEIADR